MTQVTHCSTRCPSVCPFMLMFHVENVCTEFRVSALGRHQELYVRSIMWHLRHSQGWLWMWCSDIWATHSVYDLGNCPLEREVVLCVCVCVCFRGTCCIHHLEEKVTVNRRIWYKDIYHILPSYTVILYCIKDFTLVKEKAYPSGYVEPILFLDTKSLIMAS
jgi:hypothetical protein